jgi:hypothetical protein
MRGAINLRGLLGEGIAAFKAVCDLGRILNRGYSQSYFVGSVENGP